jgi:hypothetical protein
MAAMPKSYYLKTGWYHLGKGTIKGSRKLLRERLAEDDGLADEYLEGLVL